jgi:ligand-binding sensor domain-containing protein/DNA-binding response OmpR family regulator/nitrogen-specific signal transduction histidine kinase
MKLKTLNYLLLLLPFLAFAQNEVFYHFGLEEGLSQQTVQTILKDKSGFIWLGTQEGLNRFDGTSFKVFKNDLDKYNSISGNNIKKLFDYKNYLIIGTKNNGICIYDKKERSFIRTKLSQGLCTGITIYKEKLFVSLLNEGVFSLELKNNQAIISNILNFSNTKTTALAVLDNVLLIGSSKGEVSFYNLDQKKINQKINLKNSEEKINVFFQDGNRLWIGTDAGLFCYNNINQKKIRITLKKASERIRINDIIKIKTNYYLATDNGLYIVNDFDKQTSTFNQQAVFYGDKNTQNSITSNRVYDILYYNNILWIGTNKLDILPLQTPVFKAIDTKSKPTLNNNHIYSITRNDNYLFIGTRNGLNCIDNDGKNTIITKENSNNQLAYNVVRGMCLDNKQRLWLATTKGLSVLDLKDFNPEKPKIQSFYHNDLDDSSLSNNNTRSIFLDKLGTVWVTTFGGGVDRFTGDLDTKKISFQHFKKENSKNSISSDFVFAINQTASNVYWLSTDNGLNKLKFKNKQFNDVKVTVFNKNLNTINTLKSNTIFTVKQDKSQNNILWIGTSNGLHRYNINTNIFDYFGVKNGLTNLVVYAILEDSKSKLWLSTNDGIFKFDKETLRFTNYNTIDGIKNREFNLGASFNDTQKKQLYFGGTNGITYFATQDLDRLYHEGILEFTSLFIKGNEYRIDKQQVNLKYKDFPAQLDFANLDYTFPNSSQFVYKLLPHDNTWNPVDKQQYIQFVNLKDGDYQLLIQGKNKDKLWSKSPLKINITVHPPWYKSIWAYLFYSLLFLSLVLGLYHFQLKRSLEKKETLRLKELNDLKTKLYANITHEFRTPLTVISGIADTLRENKDSNKKTSYLDMIKRNSNNLLQLVNQILDLAKSEKGQLKLQLESDDIIIYIKYLVESFSSFANEKNIAIIYYNEINSLIMDFDKDKVNKIMTNLLSNAIKFSKEDGKIIVYVKQQENDLLIEVKDNGIGISKTNLPHIFDRFYQVENKSGAGTGIGLALVKELVHLMNGNISVQSKENRETIFKITLPIMRKQIQKEKEAINLLDTQNPIVLIVEDNKDVATYIKLCIEKDYLVLMAKNGKEGIQIALEQVPDIIISDVMMPLVDGYELCKTLKEDEKTNHIPIILLTAKNSQESKIQGLRKGADAYLTKPFNKEELLIRLQKLITIRSLLAEKYKNLNKVNLEKNLNDKNTIFIQKAIKLIQENIDNTDYNATVLATDLFLSESQLYRKLKALSTYSTAIFIRKVRLQKAKNLLENSAKTIAEICYETGFSNPSWFSKAFKKEFGFAPSERRN